MTWYEALAETLIWHSHVVQPFYWIIQAEHQPKECFTVEKLPMGACPKQKRRIPMAKVVRYHLIPTSH